MPILLLAADLYGTKVNYSFPLADGTPVGHLRAEAERILTQAAAARRPHGAPPEPVRAERLQYWDEGHGAWRDVGDATPLPDFAQLYLLQRDSEWHREQQGKIPPPVPAPGAEAPGLSSPHPREAAWQSPARDRPPGAEAAGSAGASLPQPSGASPGASSPQRSPSRVPPLPADDSWPLLMRACDAVPWAERVHCVFADMDSRRTRATTRGEWESLFRRSAIDLAPATVVDLFTEADDDLDGVVGLPEFERWCARHPQLLGCLHARVCSLEQEAACVTEMRRERERACDAAQQQHRHEAAVAQLRFEEAALREVADERARGQQQAVQAESGAREEHTHAVAAAQQARARAGQAAGGAQHAAQRELAAKDAHVKAKAEVVAVGSKLTAQRDALRLAEERLRAAQQLLAEREREHEMHRALHDRYEAEQRAAADLEAATEAAIAEAQQAADEAHQQCAIVEVERKAADDVAFTVGAELARQEQAAGEQRARAEQAAVELAQCQERVRSAEAQAEALRAAAQQAAGHAAMLEQRARSLAAARRDAAAVERPLLEQEIRVGAQRARLEEEEARLRGEALMLRRGRQPGGSPAPGAPPASPPGPAETWRPPRRSDIPPLPPHEFHDARVPLGAPASCRAATPSLGPTQGDPGCACAAARSASLRQPPTVSYGPGSPGARVGLAPPPLPPPRSPRAGGPAY
eukprot:TRINITY_DN23322_c0_g1_i1.p1 TRINITY_DN23322_c0_g1~~TRINITY_DN23322_c0_g1_i1.p1  ORF type:complete len:722 (+),score=250.63 TRINITY_DN23322_c0_g1_i1:84-2168(+)